MTKTDRVVIIWLLLAIGAVLVCFAAPISNFLCPPLPQAGGGYINRDADILQAVFICRCLGFMVFTAGLAERLALAISGLAPEQPRQPQKASKPRQAWSLPDEVAEENGSV